MLEGTSGGDVLGWDFYSRSEKRGKSWGQIRRIAPKPRAKQSQTESQTQSCQCLRLFCRLLNVARAQGEKERGAKGLRRWEVRTFLTSNAPALPALSLPPSFCGETRGSDWTETGCCLDFGAKRNELE